ncbi:MAG: TIGR00341 family protein [Fulvivirga sp.]|nr:TIGR00341 family protein [Fulvivirga sp.]
MRLLEIVIPADQKEEFDGILNNDRIIEKWTTLCENETIALKLLTEQTYAKELLDILEKRDDYRVVIYPVEGTLPKVDENEKSEEDRIKLGKFVSISKEELYNDVAQPVSLSANFILMVILSSFVAGIGILKDNVAILIGAMVIAPFLGPNISMAFGTTLGEMSIIKKSIRTGIVATIIALGISFAWGYMAGDVSDIATDPDIELRDILLALICGFAGVISVISGQGSSLVGVMVAAALLPPLFRGGLLLGGKEYSSAINSLMIFSAYIISVNIAGIITFSLAGVRPGKWWEKEKAKKHMRKALIVWGVALVILIIAIYIMKEYN